MLKSIFIVVSLYFFFVSVSHRREPDVPEVTRRLPVVRTQLRVMKLPETPKIDPLLSKHQTKKPLIAICAATHSKSNWRNVASTTLQKLLIPSIRSSVSAKDRSKYDFRLYLAADDDDSFWLRNKNKLTAPDWLPISLGFYKTPKHKIPFNPMMRAAYNDGAEYMVRINDDSEFVTPNWVSKGVSKLASYNPPNVGMVGPNCLEGNRKIMTHDMVHRTHLDIFEHYYPDVFSAWWIDDWISKVYGPTRSTKIMDWRVKHHVHKYGTRYKVQRGEAKFLKGELKKGAVKIKEWLLQNNADADVQECANYAPSQYIWDSDVISSESGWVGYPPNIPSDWSMDRGLLRALSKNHRTAYKEIISAYQQASFDQKITALGKDFSHQRVATIKNALCDTSGLVVDTGNCHVFRNGGCSIDKTKKISMKKSMPTYDKVITIAMKWGSETWHFVGEALVGLAYVQNIDAYKIHVSAKTNFVVEWLRVIGVEEHQIVTGTVFAKTLLIPELGKCGNPSPQQILWLQEKIKSYLPIKKQDQHTLIVKRTKSRTQANWEDILKVVKQFNQNVVVHDDSNLPTVQQQLENFRNAHTVIAPHGAGLLNILASRPNTKVIEFMDPNNMNLCYARLAYILGLKYNAIELNSSMGRVSEVFEQKNHKTGSVEKAASTIVLTKGGHDGMGHMLLGAFSLQLYARLDDNVKLVKRNDNKTPNCRGSKLCKAFYLRTEQHLPKRTPLDKPKKKDNAWPELSSWCEPGKASETRMRRCKDERKRLAREWSHMLDSFRIKHKLIKKKVGTAVHIRKGDAVWGPNVNSPSWIRKTIRKFFSNNNIDVFMQYRGDADEYVSVLDNPIQHVGGDTFHTWLHFIDAKILYVSATSFTLSAAIFRNLTTVSNSALVHKGRYDWNVKKCKIDDLWYQNGYGNDDDCRLEMTTSVLNVKTRPTTVSVQGQFNTNIDEMFDGKNFILEHADTFRDLQNAQKANALEGHIFNQDSTGEFRRMPQLESYTNLVYKNRENIHTICETGFNGGHSTVLWASIIPDVEIISFDMCIGTRCEIGKAFFDKLFPKASLTIIRGDSRKSIPRYWKSQLHGQKKCDFISVDGGHFNDVPRLDIENMIKMARPNALIVMDDIDKKSQKEYLRTVGLAWFKAVEQNLVTSEKCERCYRRSDFANTCTFCIGHVVDSNVLTKDVNEVEQASTSWTISNDEWLSRPISSSDFRDSYLHCIESMGPFEPKICVSENCEFFPSKSGVSRPNTAVGAALFCLGKSRYTSSVLELGTEKASGTRQIALGARQGRPMRITTIEGRKTQYEQTVKKWSKKFPEIDWVLGSTINTLSSQKCFQKHYQLDNTDVASNAILSSTCTSMSTLDSVFMDTTICTAMNELKTVMSECSNVWLLIAHDLDNKYKAKDIVAYTGWVEIYRHLDQFSNTDKDYCDCKANPKKRKSGRAQVGVFFNPERFSRSITYLEKEKAGNKIYQSWTIVITVSIGFDDMFTNWWFHYSKLNLDMDVIMVAEDRPTFDKYSSIPGIEVWYAEYEDSKETKSLTYNTVQYKKLVSRRASHILRVLDSNPNIIYTDIDTVWLQDPRPYFTGKFDIWAQLDDVNYYCTGFMAIIKSDKVVHFLKDWNEQLRKKPQLNQPIFNKIIHKSRLKHKALPLKEFPSGKLYFQQKKRDGVVIVHNNFIIGKDKKIKRFKDIGLWAPAIKVFCCTKFVIPGKCQNEMDNLIYNTRNVEQISDISANFDFSNSIVVDRQRLNEIGKLLYKSRQKGRTSKGVGGYMMADITNSFDKQYLRHFDFVLRQHYYHPLKGMTRKQPIQALSSIACPSDKTPKFVSNHFPLGEIPYEGDSPGGTWWIHPQSPTTVKNIAAAMDHLNPIKERDTLCSFKGSFQSHSDRQRVKKLFETEGKPLHCKIINTGSFASGDPKEYSTLVGDTIFTLCPRGTGKETMRFMDALRFGSIPVVIYEPYLDIWPVTPPVIIVKSWQEAIQKITDLKDDISILENMQKEGQAWLQNEEKCQKKSMQALIHWSNNY